MRLAIITTTKTFEFALPNTSSINKVNLEIVKDLENKKLPYITIDYPFICNQGFIVKHPIPINKQYIISWYITEY